jgi:hypothetical protein
MAISHQPLISDKRGAAHCSLCLPCIALSSSLQKQNKIWQHEPSSHPNHKKEKRATKNALTLNITQWHQNDIIRTLGVWRQSPIRVISVQCIRAWIEAGLSSSSMLWPEKRAQLFSETNPRYGMRQLNEATVTQS